MVLRLLALSCIMAKNNFCEIYFSNILFVVLLLLKGILAEDGTSVGVLEKRIYFSPTCTVKPLKTGIL